MSSSLFSQLEKSLKEALQIVDKIKLEGVTTPNINNKEENTMKKFAIVVGHGYGSDKGAVSQDGKVTEYDWNKELGEMIVKELPHSQLVFRDVPYSKLPAKINALGVDYAVELHLNSFHNPTATGVEMLYWHTSPKGKQLAEVVQKAAVTALGLPDRGVKPKNDGDRGAGILKNTSMPCIIAEFFFVSNPNDLKVATENKEKLAKAVAKVLQTL